MMTHFPQTFRQPQRGWIVFIFLALLIWAMPLSAQDVTDDDVNEVASQLYCPTCEAIPVDVCPTQVCQDWRQEIRTQLTAGRSEAEILAYFADRYGEGVLANAPAQGIGLVIWIVPIVIVLLVAAVFIRTMSGLRRQTDAPIPPPPGTE